MDQIPQLTFNLVFFILIGGLAVVGLFFGEGRIRLVALGAFMALFIMNQISDPSFNSISKPVGSLVGQNNVGSTIGGVVFLLFIVGAFLGNHKKGSNIRGMLLGIVTGLFVMSYGTALLPSQVKDSIVGNYNLAAIITSIRPYILIATIVLILVSIFMPEKNKDDKK